MVLAKSEIILGWMLKEEEDWPSTIASPRVAIAGSLVDSANP